MDQEHDVFIFLYTIDRFNLQMSLSVREVMPKTHMFAPGERRHVEIWVVAGYHRNLLFTDDSFQFARAMREVLLHH